MNENEEDSKAKESEDRMISVPCGGENAYVDNDKVSGKQEEENSENALDLERAAEEALLQVDSEKEIEDKWGDTPLPTRQLLNAFPSRKTSK